MRSLLRALLVLAFGIPATHQISMKETVEFFRGNESYHAFYTGITTDCEVFFYRTATFQVNPLQYPLAYYPIGTKTSRLCRGSNTNFQVIHDQPHRQIMMVDRANGGVITFNYDTHFRNHEGRFAIVPEWPPEKSSLRACKIPKNTIFHIHYNNNGIRQRVLRAAEDGKNKNWDSNIHYDSKSISKCERPLCEDNCDVMRLPERRFKHIRLIQEDKKFQFEAQNFFHVKVVFTDGQKIIARSTADPKSGMVIDLATRQQYHFPWPENTIAFAFFYLEIPHKENKNVKQKFEWSSDWEYIGTKIEPDYENVPIGPSTTTVPTDILEESDCVKGRNKKRCTYAGIGAGVATNG
ncbi:hypothetical protein L596_008295 [Steinernema carpocapsae]|uniref:Uncharacterized protein n=1 Tax=Steinernema carpocapsae TaxID=34508 RepID=A0A4U5PCK2_STECR|nr:hypothetical protein L596_008295 [Steinernema carpocapsae]